MFINVLDQLVGGEVEGRWKEGGGWMEGEGGRVADTGARQGVGKAWRLWETQAYLEWQTR